MQYSYFQSNPWNRKAVKYFMEQAHVPNIESGKGTFGFFAGNYVVEYCAIEYFFSLIHLFWSFSNLIAKYWCYVVVYHT